MLITGERWTPGWELHDPGTCRITHGPCDSYFPNLVGKSAASIRRSLATAFDIPKDAEAFIGGSVVAGQYRLLAGGWLEFVKCLVREFRPSC